MDGKFANLRKVAAACFVAEKGYTPEEAAITADKGTFQAEIAKAVAEEQMTAEEGTECLLDRMAATAASVLSPALCSRYGEKIGTAVAAFFGNKLHASQSVCAAVGKAVGATVGMVGTYTIAKGLKLVATAAKKICEWGRSLFVGNSEKEKVQA